MIQKRFDDITKDDIDALVQNGIGESRTLEYKEAIPGSTRDDKKEFLADVSAFANAAGGDLIYGIVEKRDSQNRQTGIPDSAPGLANVNLDQEKQRLENLLRDGVDPRLPLVQIKEIDEFADGPVLLLRIRQSWNAPHMNTLDSRFYSRTSSGKYPLDVSEIRSAFALSEALPQRIRNFRTERLSRIVADETPIRLRDQAKLILHVVSWETLEPTVTVDLYSFLQNQENRLLLDPMNVGGWNSRYNFDGYLTHSSDEGYLQLFRNGGIEMVNTATAVNVNEGMAVASGVLVNSLIIAIENVLKIMDKLERVPPYYILITLYGVKGYRLATRNPVWHRNTHPLDRDLLLMPEMVVEDRTTDVHQLLRPVLDTLWQSVGYSQCEYYGDSGQWLG